MTAVNLSDSTRLPRQIRERMINGRTQVDLQAPPAQDIKGAR